MALGRRSSRIWRRPRREPGCSRKHQGCLVQDGRGQWHRTGYRWSPVRTLPMGPLWCDLGRCSRTVVVIKLRRTSASGGGGAALGEGSMIPSRSGSTLEWLGYHEARPSLDRVAHSLCQSLHSHCDGDGRAAGPSSSLRRGGRGPRPAVAAPHAEQRASGAAAADRRCRRTQSCAAAGARSRAPLQAHARLPSCRSMTASRRTVWRDLAWGVDAPAL